MSQFFLYRNEDKSSNEIYPFFIDIQNSLLSDLNSRVVIPLTPYATLNKNEAKTLCPLIHLDEGDYVALTHQITSVPRSILKAKVISLENHRYELLAAIDMLISGI